MSLARSLRRAFVCCCSITALLLGTFAAVGVAPASASVWTPSTSFGAPGLNPAGIDIDPDGNLWVANGNNNNIVKFSPAGDVLLTAGGFGVGPGQINLATALAVGPNRVVYVGDIGNSRVDEFDLNGNFLGSFGNSSNFSNLRGLAVAANGDVYTADVSNGRVERFSAAGTYLGDLGSFGNPFGIGIDPDGNIWITDVSSNTVRKVSPSGSLLLTLGGFGQPLDVAFDGLGQAHITNFNTNQIYTYTLAGAPVDVTNFSDTVYGLVVGPGGQLYVSKVFLGQIAVLAPPAPPDTDGDGIPDAIDTDPINPSVSFADAGTTFGTIVSSGALSVHFVDLPDPDGVT